MLILFLVALVARVGVIAQGHSFAMLAQAETSLRSHHDVGTAGDALHDPVKLVKSKRRNEIRLDFAALPVESIERIDSRLLAEAARAIKGLRPPSVSVFPSFRPPC